VGWILSTTSDWRIAAFWWGKHKRLPLSPIGYSRLGLPHWRLAAFAVSAWLVLGWVGLRCLCFCARPEWRVGKVVSCAFVHPMNEVKENISRGSWLQDFTYTQLLNTKQCQLCFSCSWPCILEFLVVVGLVYRNFW
jgi:hypothetical protein